MDTSELLIELLGNDYHDKANHHAFKLLNQICEPIVYSPHHEDIETCLYDFFVDLSFEPIGISIASKGKIYLISYSNENNSNPCNLRLLPFGLFLGMTKDLVREDLGSPAIISLEDKTERYYYNDYIIGCKYEDEKLTLVVITKKDLIPSLSITHLSLSLSMVDDGIASFHFKNFRNFNKLQDNI